MNRDEGALLLSHLGLSPPETIGQASEEDCSVRLKHVEVKTKSPT